MGHPTSIGSGMERWDGNDKSEMRGFFAALRMTRGEGGAREMARRGDVLGWR
jgi:hypothetical protein